MQGFVTAAGEGIYDRELDKNTANYSQMTPLSFIERAAFVYPGTHRRGLWRGSAQLGADL